MVPWCVDEVAEGIQATPETKAILDALLEKRRILEAKLEAMDTRLEAVEPRLENIEAKLEPVVADVKPVKEQLADLSAREHYLTQKTGEFEAELFVVKPVRRRKGAGPGLAFRLSPQERMSSRRQRRHDCM